jgi:hypothetical protein
MKAEWIDSPDIHTCLCCGQSIVQTPDKRMTPERCEKALAAFEALGLTRADLLGPHRAKIDYQAPGFAEWLQGQ